MNSSSNSWFLYIIRTKHNKLYTGITKNIENRFEQHKAGKGAKYLKGKGPLELVFSAIAGNRSSATKLELHIKALSKSEKENLINNPEIFYEFFEKLSLPPLTD